MRLSIDALREEPFRLFFPLALLATIGGVTLWPLVNHGLLPVYPGVMHARIMTVGLAGMLMGFLGTAFPRLIDAPPWKVWEIVLLLALWLSSLTLHALGRTGIADGVFGIAAAMVTVTLALRWICRGRDTPPPGLPVALVGLLLGGTASGALAWQGGTWLGPAEYRLAHLLLYQGMALLALLGVGPYLFPRLFGAGSTHGFESSPGPPPGWWPRFGICVSVGLTVHGSFVLEAMGYPRGGMGLRAGAVIAWVLLETPLLGRARSLTTCGTAVRVALLSIVGALAWAAVDPSHRVGILHLFFVSGLGLVMLGIGVRVVLGHAGRHDLLAGKIVWLRVVIGLALLAAATRVSADYLPQIRVSHLDYAAATWVGVAGLWLWKLRRSLTGHESGEDPRKCPKSRGRTEADG